MWTKFRTYWLLVLGCLPGGFAWAQANQTAPADTVSRQKIEILQANELEGGTFQGVEIRKVRGDVIFRHQGALMYCDSAYQYAQRNAIEAFGRVRIVQGDTLTLTGDSLSYDGATRMAKVRGQRVVMQDPKMTLTTQYLNFDMGQDLAYYFNGGTIVDESSTLTSEQGYYRTDSKYLFFKEDVVLVGQDPPYRLESDTLEYSTITKEAFFRAPTRIVSQGRVLEASRGKYNTVTAVSNFAGRARVQNEDYILIGDSLIYDETRRRGRAWGDVEMIARRDSIIIEGDRGVYDGVDGLAQVFGRGVMTNIMGGDTLRVAADTLVSIDRPQLPQKKLLAYPQVRIFRPDLQGRCDSLVYDRLDSLIYLFQDPVLWSEGNQIQGDTVQVHMLQNRIHRMITRQSSFIVSRDSLKNYNQVKGRHMVAYFDDQNYLSRIEVDGNGQSIYFALEGDTVLAGMNRVDCSDMLVRLRENKMQEIVFINQPDARFIPPHELREPDRRLKGFRWRSQERPVRADVIRKESLSLPPTNAPPAEPPVLQPAQAPVHLRSNTL